MVYPAAYEAAVEEAKIEPVDRANVSALQVEDGKGFSFKATVTVKPEVTVKNYKGIKAEKTVETVSYTHLDVYKRQVYHRADLSG